MTEKVRVGMSVHRGGVNVEPADGVPATAHRSAQRWPPEYAAKRDRLVRDHLPLVHRLCRKFHRSGEPVEDLVQVGSIGLLKAIEKFDPDRGFNFMTYAVPVIVGEIKNYLRDHGWAVKVPRKIQRHNLAVQRAVDSLSPTLGRGPTIQEIAEATGLTSEEIYDTLEVGNYGRPLSLDAEHNANGNQDLYSLLDYLGGDDPQFDLVSDRIDLSNTFSCLDQREKTIIHLKFYTGLSQTEIAKRLGISQMHVSRLQRNALDKLRQHLTK